MLISPLQMVSLPTVAAHLVLCAIMPSTTLRTTVVGRLMMGRAALPSLLRNDLARHWVNRFRPELKCLEVRSALSPAAAMRRLHSSDRGPS